MSANKNDNDSAKAKSQRPKGNRGQPGNKGFNNSSLMLKPGNNNNFATVWPKLVDKATESYGRAAQIMEKGTAYQQPPIDIAKYRVPRPVFVTEGDPVLDQDGLNKVDKKGKVVTYDQARADVTNQQRQDEYDLAVEAAKGQVAQAGKNRERLINQQREDEVKIYSFIWSHLSHESRECIAIQTDYDIMSENKDLGTLVKHIWKTHKLKNAAFMDPVQSRYVAQKNLFNIQKRDNEFIAAYFQRFKDTLQVYIDEGYPDPPDSEQAMLFVGSLDEAHFADYQRQLSIDVSQKARGYPADLTAAYREAVTYSVVTQEHSAGKRGGGRRQNHEGYNAFASGKDTSKKDKKHNNSDKNKNKNAKAKQGGGTDTTKPRGKCYICHQVGHYMADCPEAEGQGGDDAGEANFATAYHSTGLFPDREMAESQVAAYASVSGPARRYEVLLDQQSNLNVVQPILCSKFRAISPVQASVGGKRFKIAWEGWLEHFGWVYASDETPQNILCQYDVAQQYQIDYLQREHCYDVHLRDRILRFENRRKYCVADFSDWCEQQDLEDAVEAYVTTVQDLEATLTKAQLRKLRAAREFIANAGFPSEQEAVHLLTDGNIQGDRDFEPEDVRRAYRIPDNPHSVRGKRTDKKVKRQATDIEEVLINSQQTQVVQVDVMCCEGKKFLMGHVDPLKLMLAQPLSEDSEEGMRGGLDKIVETIKSHKWSISEVQIEPTPAARCMVGTQGDVPIIPVGAGEHLEHVDRGIRSVKEIVRCTKSALPFKLIPSLAIDLVTFAVSRKNCRRGTTKLSVVAPKVEFTGRRIHKRDFIGGFGTYIEAYKGTSNTNKIRTHSAILLYPMHNSSGSWRAYDLITKRRIIKSNFVVMPVTQLVIDTVNGIADAEVQQQARRPRNRRGDPGPEPELAAVAQDAPGEGGVVPDLANLNDDDAQDDEGAAENQDDDDAQDDDGGQGEENISPPPGILPLRELDRDGPQAPDEDDGDALQEEDRGATLDEPHVQYDVPLRRSVRIRSAYVADTVPKRAKVTVRGGVRRRGVHRKPPSSTSILDHEAFHSNVYAQKGFKKYGNKAVEALLAEMEGLFDTKKVLLPRDVTKLSNSQKKRIIRSHLFFKEKWKQGAFDKLKARLVARGDMQDAALYPDNASPTVALESIMMLLSIASIERRSVAVLDIGMAYVNADMTGEEVFVELDPFITRFIKKYKPELKPFVGEDGKLVCKLNKALYGCVQSAKLWYECLCDFLEEQGFVKNEADSCVFNKIIDGQQVTAAVFVDDLLITCKSGKPITVFAAAIKNRFGDIKFEHDGAKMTYLGMNVRKTAVGLHVDMDDYVKELLTFAKPKRNSMRKIRTPASDQLFEQAKDDAELNAAEGKFFHTTVAKMLYLTMRVRPDIAVAVAYLTTRVKGPTEGDKWKLNRVLCYLEDQPSSGIMLPTRGKMQLQAYVDAGFACHGDGKSQTGMCISLGNSLISARSVKQKMVAKDSTEAELIALSDKVTTVLWCQDFLRSQGYEDLPPPVLHQDNMSTVHLVTKGGGNPRTRHLKARQFMVKELCDNKEIEVVYTRTSEMIADVLTKPLGGDNYRLFVRSMTHDGAPLTNTSTATTQGCVAHHDDAQMAKDAKRGTRTVRQRDAVAEV